MADDSVSGGGGAPSADPDAWRHDDRARTDALRARIASLAAGPDDSIGQGDGGLEAAVSAAIDAALRDLLPALVDEHVRPVVQAAVAELAPQVFSAVDSALNATFSDDERAPYLEIDGLEPRLAALEDALSGLSERVEEVGRTSTDATSALFDALRTDLAAVSGYADPAAGGAAAGDAGASSEAILATVVEEMESLRSDMAAALEYVQDQVVRRSDEGFTRTGQALLELSTTLSAEIHDRPTAEVEDGRLAAFETVVEEVRQARIEISAARGSIDALAVRAGESLEETAERVRAEAFAVLDPIREEFVVTTESQRADLAALSDGVRDDVATLVEDVASRVAAGAEAATAAAQSAAALEARSSIDAATRELLSTADTIEDQSVASAAEVARLALAVTAAGRAVLDHLAARDLLLEQVRDELAAELLEDFASGLSDKDRKAATKKLGGLLQRRRNARDAERWRDGRPPVPVLPPGIEDEAVVLEELARVASVPVSEDSGARQDAPGAEPAVSSAGAVLEVSVHPIGAGQVDVDPVEVTPHDLDPAPAGLDPLDVDRFGADPLGVGAEPAGAAATRAPAKRAPRKQAASAGSAVSPAKRAPVKRVSKASSAAAADPTASKGAATKATTVRAASKAAGVKAAPAARKRAAKKAVAISEDSVAEDAVAAGNGAEAGSQAASWIPTSAYAPATDEDGATAADGGAGDGVAPEDAGGA